MKRMGRHLGLLGLLLCLLAALQLQTTLTKVIQRCKSAVVTCFKVKRATVTFESCLYLWSFFSFSLRGFDFIFLTKPLNLFCRQSRLQTLRLSGSSWLSNFSDSWTGLSSSLQRLAVRACQFNIITNKRLASAAVHWPEPY